MKILHIISTLDPAAGGPGEAVRSLLTFGPADYSQEVVTLDSPESSFHKDLSCPVHRLGPTRSVYAYNSKLRGWLKEHRHRFDGVIVNGLWQYCGLAAWLALRGKTPYVVFTHGMLDPYFKHAFPSKHRKKWLYWLAAEYWILRDAYRVLFTTREESRLAEQSFWLHRWRGYVVPFGASRPPATPEVLRSAFDEQLPELKNKRLLLFLGRIHHKKGCDLLVNAFIKYASLDPDLHLVMAGPDQEGWSAELQRTVEQAGLAARVHWPGMIKGNAKWGAFYASEVFILPSHQENFGIAVAEALGCGLPALLSDKVNIAPEIAEDRAGLMEADTQEGTDKLVRGWIELSSEERAAMRTQAILTFETRYNMEKNAETIVRIFENATAGRQPAKRSGQQGAGA